MTICKQFLKRYSCNSFPSPVPAQGHCAGGYLLDASTLSGATLVLRYLKPLYFDGLQ